jgi:leucyl-tRNA synthetase
VLKENSLLVKMRNIMERYNPKEIEKKWRQRWEKEKTFKVDLAKAKKPFYNLMMFPYPSGEGLHVGHVYAFGGSDTFGRFKRLQGYDVFEPMGFDSFGIHSENYAIKVGKHPRQLIDETTTYFREEQLKKLGALFDWDHQVITSDPDYYRWTQWLFIQLFKTGLAVRKKAPVDWCPSCKTVLADEQVIAGKCERCAAQVVQKELEQWFFRITDYAERLLKNLDHLEPDTYGPKVKLTKEQMEKGIDWSETTKTMQRNWIGRSEGALIKFKVQSSKFKISQGFVEVFTTRPDTIFGATFMVLAPEHPLVAKLLNSEFRINNSELEKVKDYTEQARKKTEVEREKEKTGVFTGLYCINPLTKKEIPIWIADYVLMGYGTGAIMGVPAHDVRDYEFAKKYKLPIVEVISGGDPPAGGEKEAYVGEGKLVNSGQFNGLGVVEAIKKISEYIEKNQLGKKTVNYHLRDWLISRQRYWGPPIPMVYCESCAKNGKSWFDSQKAELKIQNSKFKIENSAQWAEGWYPVPEENLPVELPELKDYRPKGSGASPLANLPGFVNVKCPECGKPAKRETDVSDTFLDSSWYFLRYPNVGIQKEVKLGFSGTKIKNQNELERNIPWDPEITKKWLPVDSYIGGNEHACLHLLYTRFITMALHDMGFIDFEEPFKKFRAHGLIIHGGAKMSKSRGNVVNPNEYMQAYGADALRMYLLFIGPYDLGGDFSDRSIAGVYRFLNRVWQTVLEISPPSREAGNQLAKSASASVAREINKVIKKVGEDVEHLRFNTAIAALMEFLNFAVKHKREIDIDTIRKYLIILSIFAPFTAEELWERIGEKESIHQQSWPAVEEKWLEEEKTTIAVLVDGKLRDTLEVQNSPTFAKASAGKKLRIQDVVEKIALESVKVKKHLEGKKIKKTVYVPGKIINFVTK